MSSGNAQGSDRIEDFWQLDAYVQADLARLPGRGVGRPGLRA